MVSVPWWVGRGGGALRGSEEGREVGSSGKTHSGEGRRVAGGVPTCRRGGREGNGSSVFSVCHSSILEYL